MIVLMWFVSPDASTSRYPALGLAAGAVFGVIDFLLIGAAGIEITWEGRPAVLVLTVFFAAAFAGLGYVIGMLVHQGAELQRAGRQLALLDEQVDLLEGRRRADEAWFQKEAQRLHALAAMGEVSAGIAHAVRNPLGVIRSSGELIREVTEPDGSAHRASGFILEHCDRLDGFIDRLLDYVHPLRPKRERFGLRAVFERAVATVALSPGIRLEWHGDAEHAAAIDPDLVARALAALIVNADEALGGTGRIGLAWDLVGDHAHLEVADDGAGLSEDDALRAFEPFWSRRPSGTGLGLPNVHKIALAHGGRPGSSRRDALLAFSYSNTGGLFWIKLPNTSG